jgi:putative sterol carrier protein
VNVVDEVAQEILFITFNAVISDVIADKRKNPKNTKMLDEFQARLNIGLHVEEDFILWVNLVAENGKYVLGKGKLDEYDLELISDPEDLMYFTNGEYSTMKMMLGKNRFGERRLRYRGGTTGRNMGKLLKLPKILVLDK